jgi:hypothetical protein
MVNRHIIQHYTYDVLVRASLQYILMFSVKPVWAHYEYGANMSYGPEVKIIDTYVWAHMTFAWIIVNGIAMTQSKRKGCRMKASHGPRILDQCRR